jgi:hypothetical protein
MPLKKKEASWQRPGRIHHARVGQFCTNPVVCLEEREESRLFAGAAGAEIDTVPTAPMLTATISDTYAEGVSV